MCALSPKCRLWDWSSESLECHLFLEGEAYAWFYTRPGINYLAGTEYCSGLDPPQPTEIPFPCPVKDHAWGGNFIRIIDGVQSWKFCGKKRDFYKYCCTPWKEYDLITSCYVPEFDDGNFSSQSHRQGI